MDSDMEKLMIMDDFKNHIIRDHQVLFRAGSPRVEVMTWGNKNGETNCRIDYMLRNGSLCVYGDLGEAVYRWHAEISLEWIAGLHLGYFHEKCDASGEGSGVYSGSRPYAWDGDKAKKGIQAHIRDWMKGGSISTDYYRDYEAKSELKDLFRSCDDLSEFTAYLHTGQPHLAVNDDDWWEWLPKVGREIPIRIRMHLIGLKLAFGRPTDKYC